MKIISATTRVTFGLICLSVSAWLVAFTLGMFPDTQVAVVQGRVGLCENVALHCSLLASRGDCRTMETALQSLVQRNKDVLSAAVRQPNGLLLVAVGNHNGQWKLPPGNRSTATQMRVPILAGESDWGTVELRFREPTSAGVLGWLGNPMVVLFSFVAALTGMLFSLYLRSMLKHLDPSRVISPRVRDTLDTLAEGLLVLDQQEQILLANRSFADSLGATADELTGLRASDLAWETDETRRRIEGYPWQRALSEQSPQLGDLMTIRDRDRQRRVLKVSAAPVYADDGQPRGTLASFDDVTQIEQNRVELRQMLDSLSQSRDEIHRQNLELERLASRDPLTGCLNRRAFFGELEHHWSTSAAQDDSLSCIMIDLDHFKSINDTHGHQMGDAVLQKTGELLRTARRHTDAVGRYGGEEFIMVLPHTDLETAAQVAEWIRQTIEAGDFDQVAVTASVGVSARVPETEDPQAMIDQADKCLYVAKREGRNRVVRFDQARADFEASNDSPASTNRDGEAAAEPCQSDPTNGSEGASSSQTRDEYKFQSCHAGAHDSSIPFHAVTALVSALAYRDSATADHSRRVADLCTATARHLMPVHDSYSLEIAALLHDIGKIGVPDAILLKPEKLTEEEWQVMNSHEKIGAEIVQATFSCPRLGEIIRTYRAWFSGNLAHPQLPTGDDIPLSARILAIADAYDSMTNCHAYRETLRREQAFAELRRCAVRQFDPDLVERFIDTVSGCQGGETDMFTDTSKPAALSFGTQVERLAEALDNQDLATISALARRLNMTAVKHDVADIAQVAAQLEEASRDESDVMQLAQLTADLVDLCRAAQRAHLEEATGSGRTGRESHLDSTDTIVLQQQEPVARSVHA